MVPTRSYVYCKRYVTIVAFGTMNGSSVTAVVLIVILSPAFASGLIDKIPLSSTFAISFPFKIIHL